MSDLEKDIEHYYAAGAAATCDPTARATFQTFREALTAGNVRAAEKINGTWRTNAWVKKGILLGFRIGALVQSGADDGLGFVDKDTYPMRRFTAAERVRIVP